VLVVPIAFTSDHIETLYELDIEVKEKAHKSGVTNFFRSPSINDDPLMGTLMAELVADHLKSGQVSSAQYSLRYIHCCCVAVLLCCCVVVVVLLCCCVVVLLCCCVVLLCCWCLLFVVGVCCWCLLWFVEVAHVDTSTLRCGGCSSPQCRNILNPVSAYTRPSLPWHPDDKKY